MKLGFRKAKKDFNGDDLKDAGIKDFPTWKVGDIIYVDGYLYSLIDDLDDYFE